MNLKCSWDEFASHNIGQIHLVELVCAHFGLVSMKPVSSLVGRFVFVKIYLSYLAVKNKVTWKFEYLIFHWSIPTCLPT